MFLSFFSLDAPGDFYSLVIYSPIIASLLVSQQCLAFLLLSFVAFFIFLLSLISFLRLPLASVTLASILCIALFPSSFPCFFPLIYLAFWCFSLLLFTSSFPLSTFSVFLYDSFVFIAVFLSWTFKFPGRFPTLSFFLSFLTFVLFLVVFHCSHFLLSLLLPSVLSALNLLFMFFYASLFCHPLSVFFISHFLSSSFLFCLYFFLPSFFSIITVPSSLLSLSSAILLFLASFFFFPCFTFVPSFFLSYYIYFFSFISSLFIPLVVTVSYLSFSFFGPLCLISYCFHFAVSFLILSLSLLLLISVMFITVVHIVSSF